MITCQLTKDYETIHSIITNPLLFKLTYGQVQDVSTFCVDRAWQYILIKNDDVILGCVQCQEFNAIILEVHIFLLPEFHGTGIVKELSESAHGFIRELGYRQVFTKIPSVCTHVLKCVQNLNYKCCGMIEKGVVYNNILCTLFLYNFEV